MMQFARHAARAFFGAKLFFTASCLTLAVAVGASAAIFAVAYGLLWKPLPYVQLGRLVAVEESGSRALTGNVVPLPLAKLWGAVPYPLAGTAEWQPEEADLSATGVPRRVLTAEVSRNFLSLLAVTVKRGGQFGPGAKQVLLTAATARGLGPKAVPGEVLTLNGKPYRVAGVLPVNFRFPAAEQPALLLPAPPAPPGWIFFVHVVARLRADASVPTAAAALAQITRSRSGQLPASLVTLLRGARPRVIPLRDAWAASARPILWASLAGVLCLLAVAWAVLAGLGITRHAQRRRQLALRCALGATPSQTLWAAAAEGVGVAIAGGVIGLILGSWGFRFLHAAGLPAAPGGFGLAAAVFTLALLGVSVVLVGLLPAWHAARADPATALRAGGPTLSPPGRGRRGLAGFAAALAVLLCCAGLLLAHTVANLLAVQPGFRADHVLVARISLPPAAVAAKIPQAILRRVRALPGARAAAFTGTPPLGGFVGTAPVSTAPGLTPPQIPFTFATQGFLRSMGIPLLAGQGLAAGASAGPPQVLVTRSFAQRMFGPESVVGRSIWLGEGHPTAMRVAGVVGDYRQWSLDHPPQPEVIFPYAAMPGGLATVLVWTRGDPAALAPSLRRLVHALAPDAPLFGVTTTSAILSQASARPRAEMTLFGLLAALTLALAVFGVYSLTALDAQARRREIAVRKAVGAGNGQILTATLWRAAAPAGIGIAAGLLAAAGLTRYLASLLYAVRPLDPASFALAAGLTTTAVLAACLFPARRAARLDPAAILREE